MSIKHLVRNNIVRLKPYSSARDDFKGKADVWLDANESPFNSQFNRYPDPHHSELRFILAKVKKVYSDQLLLGNGSDEIIDLIFKTFCEPGKDKVLCFTPTYGMYQVAADIHGCEVINISLNDDFEIPLQKTWDIMEFETPKIAFICSPNNPTGNLIPLDQIEQLLGIHDMIVVVDEAYIDFAAQESRTEWIESFPNLIVIQTLSKAWGLAAIRLGMAIAHKETISWIKKVKPPYNINALTLKQAMETLSYPDGLKLKLNKTHNEMAYVVRKLEQLPIVKKVFPSDANFVLATFENADDVYQALAQKGIIIRNRTKEVKDALRITIGNGNENKALIEELKKMCS